MTPARERSFYQPFARFAFRANSGVSLSAAARSAAALVYDKLTPNCHLVKINKSRRGIDTFCECLLFGD